VNDAMTQTSRDTPGVIIFPPLIPLSVLVGGLVLNFLIPLGLLAHVPLLGRIVTGGIALVVGIGMAIGAIRIFQRIGTPARPSQPTLALASTGVFTRTRNPMYVGGSLVLLGIAIGFALDWVLLLLVVSLPVLHYGIILREERYLERKFGDEYRRYKATVPRYWWR
jgi:protein-S-isoprenylcysteine O-methyltransferase Ste14